MNLPSNAYNHFGANFVYLTAYKKGQKGKKEASEQKRKDKEKKNGTDENDKSRDEEEDEHMDDEQDGENEAEEEDVENWKRPYFFSLGSTFIVWTGTSLWYRFTLCNWISEAVLQWAVVQGKLDINSVRSEFMDRLL